MTADPTELSQRQLIAQKARLIASAATDAPTATSLTQLQSQVNSANSALQTAIKAWQGYLKLHPHIQALK